MPEVDLKLSLQNTDSRKVNPFAPLRKFGFTCK